MTAVTARAVAVDGHHQAGSPYPQGIAARPHPPDEAVLLPRLARMPERVYRRLTLVIALAVLGLIGTGVWVRLSESGLGCPTWPKCYGDDLVARADYHALVEFANRCLISGVAVLIGVAVIGALLAPRRRRDLVALSLGLFAGYVAEAVLGGLTVLAKLAPALVAAHLVVAMALLADAVALHWRAGGPPGPAPPAAGRDVRRLARLLLGVLGVVVVLGTVAAGSGPYGGSPGVPRLGVHFQSAAELHAVVVMFLVGLTVAMYFAVRADAAAPAVLRAYWVLLVVTVAQGAVGYTQYFSGLPVLLVELHVLGAGVLVVAAVRFNLAVGGRPGRVRTPGARVARTRRSGREWPGGDRGASRPGPPAGVARR